MSSFTAINHPGVEDPAMKMEDVENSFDIQEDIETNHEIDEDETPAAAKGKKGAKAAVTPRKRGRKAKNAAIKNENSDEDNKENVMPGDGESPQKKTRVAAGKKGRPIPTSYENACDEDKMLLRLKDQESKTWSEIAAAWTGMTGENTKGTTLSTRYMRIKASLAVMSQEHVELLLRVKQDLEERFETEKWQRIAETMEQISGEKFTPLTLQKKFKEIEKKGLNDDAF